MPVSPADLAKFTTAGLISQQTRMIALLNDLRDRSDQLRDLHSPHRIYGECTHPDGDTDVHQSVALDDGEWTCEASYQFSVCEHCCTDSAGRTEQCAENHEHGDGLAICATVAILDGKMPFRQQRDGSAEPAQFPILPSGRLEAEVAADVHRLGFHGPARGGDA